MTVDEYVRGILSDLPRQLKDVFNAQRLQTVLAVSISDNYGETNRNPSYPRSPKGNTLQLVSGNLFKAATVYNAQGNVSRAVVQNAQVTFEWGVDLGVIPYARIHEYGGQAGRKLAATIPKRPYIGPAFQDFQDKDLPKVIDIFSSKLLRGR
jgi:phage gpG-like protein